jgi:hypothetical protein
VYVESKNSLIEGWINLVRDFHHLLINTTNRPDIYLTEKVELLKRVYWLKTSITEMETDPNYSKRFTKKELKEFKLTIKQLYSACDRIEQAIKNDDILLIF